MSRLELLEKSIASIRRQLSMKCLSGSLISCINDHGPITRENVSSAAKRLRGPFNQCLPHTDGDKDLMLIH
ncbi:hypothetical protein, partial [Streptomyces galilaeus]|uniref:hypothetical protein n=1 Tax=Streptomyces galilaeus TaxID=33899 RepID=UPI0038F5FEA1